MNEQLMRAVLWEEAKGKLHAISATYMHDRGFEEWTEALEKFIKEIEDNGVGGFT